jgi:hypothetical protein
VERIVSKGSNLGRLAAARFLGEVVSYVRELVRQLVPEKDHCNDDRDRDNGNDECVFDQALPRFVFPKSTHSPSFRRVGGHG